MTPSKPLLATLAVFLILAGGFFVWQKRQSSPIPVVFTETPTVTPVTPTDTSIDTSDWKTFRNDKYGFEFKLSDEYSIPENENNTIGEKSNVMRLDPKKSEYLFNSRKGLELSREVQTTGDASRIVVRVYPYTPLAESDFENWVSLIDGAAKFKVGTKVLDDGRTIQFVVRYSIGANSSGFFVDKNNQWIVEFDANEDAYFLHDQRDYFSVILNSVSY